MGFFFHQAPLAGSLVFCEGLQGL